MKFLFNIIFFFLTISIFISCAKEKKRKNLLIIYTDDQRPNTLSSYDINCPIQTPSIDKLAKNGIRFTEGFVTTPICGVSRACLLSGQYMSQNRVNRFQKALPKEIFKQSYPQQLKNAGYHLGILGKFGFGITEEQKAIFDEYDATTGQGPAFHEYKGEMLHDAEWLTRRTRDFLDNRPTDKPFCLQLNYKEPHPTAEPAPEDSGKLAKYPFKRVSTDNPMEHAKLPGFVQKGYNSKSYATMFGTDDKLQTYLSHYYEKILSLDRSIGEITKMLTERGVAENTVIIFLSDHGTHFGEKQMGAKWSPYEQSLRIPFIVYDPTSKTKGIVSDEMVLNIDVAPTLLDLAGVDAPNTMDGKSLTALINGDPTSQRTHFFFEHFVSPTRPVYIPRNEGVRTKKTKYLRWIDLEPVVEEFYDLEKDPMEKNNLINDANYAEKVQHSKILFENWRNKFPKKIAYRPYQKYSQFGVKEMDWVKFKAFRPKQYERIKNEIETLGVTWEQALIDWEIRCQISKNAEYWY